jgi:hypothetical protein
MKLIISNIFKQSIIIEGITFVLGVLAIWLLGAHAGIGLFMMVQFPGSVVAFFIIYLIPIVTKSDMWYIPCLLLTFILQLLFVIIVVHYFIKLRNYFAK